ncbi:exodeoxyribonuclease VII large subunit [Brevibacillus fluminis]|uniref:Exodeoxyribonuclease 7 large subunit n=1 Tax=Brevibacillus fluminis TaxID=511487 RepID=A0A3M8CZQ8_9BACL|nr:exodeoxyribonuclease VII large subunit [Brevibacillus fluminis]RNB81294.1 exodeoxyribonuclease VII large subunit [Brevibacillus fluminis]
MRGQEIWSVSDVNRYIKQKLERDEHVSDIWIRGEISNFTRHSSGHMYFTLKDGESRIKAVMFQGYNRFLKFVPKDGTKALVRGSISVYERDGAYQLYAREMQPDGLGSLYLAFEQLKEKLAQEGLFAAERKRPLPAFPRTVGVVTSPTGAAVRDICTTIRRRFPQTQILIVPATVQGTEAPASIVAAIARINRRDDVDVLIVGRGGGSIEELWAFNDEGVARAIVGSRIPVISAVGHETDVTIADFVADMRAATPTAAAELAVPHHLEWRERLQKQEQRLHRLLRIKLADHRKRLDQLQNSYALRRPQRRLDDARQRLADAQMRATTAMKQQLKREQNRLTHQEQLLARSPITQTVQKERKTVAHLQNQLAQLIGRKVAESRLAWSSSVAQLDALSPLKVMSRGFSLLYKEEQLVKSVQQIASGDKLVVRLTDGTILAEALTIEEGKTDGSQES